MTCSTRQRLLIILCERTAYDRAYGVHDMLFAGRQKPGVIFSCPAGSSWPCLRMIRRMPPGAPCRRPECIALSMHPWQGKKQPSSSGVSGIHYGIGVKPRDVALEEAEPAVTLLRRAVHSGVHDAFLLTLLREEQVL